MKKNKKSKTPHKGWNKSYHMIPCVHCTEESRGPKEVEAKLCGWCIMNDPINAFASWNQYKTGVKFEKTFKLAKKYIAAVYEKKPDPPKKVPKKAKLDGSKDVKTFHSFHLKQREKDKLKKKKEKEKRK